MRPRGSLDALFQPRSVAIFGARTAPNQLGVVLLRNLITNPFGGVVYPIDSDRRAVHGIVSYPSVAALPEVPDLAVIANPAEEVSPLVRQCEVAGVPVAVILSSGVARSALPLEPRGTAARRMRILGARSLGIMVPPAHFNATFATMARPGRVALLTQSNAIGASILDWAENKRIGFSAIVGVGQRYDLTFADLLDHLADDVATRSIVLYLESIGNVRQFLSAARSVARTKPVIVVKAGRTSAAARVETAEDDLYDTAFRRAGVLRVDTIPDLFSMSEILATQPQPRGPSLAIVGNAGAPGVMAADALLLEGGSLAELMDGARNPLDLRAEATPQRYRQAIESSLASSSVQGLLVLLSPQPATDPTEIARQLVPFAQVGKPVLACWMGGPRIQEGKAILSAAGIPTFDAPEAAVRAFLRMVQYRRAQEALYEKPEALPADGRPTPLPAEIPPTDLLATYGLGPGDASIPGFPMSLSCSPVEGFGPVLRLGTVTEGTFGLPPLNRTLARRMLERVRFPVRPSPAVLESLETLLTRFSQLVVDTPRVRNVEIPMTLSEGEVILGTGHVEYWSDDVPAEQRPGLVIHPYPNQYTAPYALRDGRTVTVRAIRPEDEELIVTMHNSHSEHTIRMRYFSLVKTLTRESLIRLCHLDYDREMALAAILDEPTGPRCIGVSRYYLDPETNAAEFALIVSDAFQRHGLGRHLMSRLVDIARERRIERLVGDILAENTPMLALMRAMNFSEPRRVSHDVVRVEMLLYTAQPPTMGED